MKKLALSFFSTLLIFTACEEDLLNRQPLSEIVPENYFTSEKELRLYTNSFYTIIPNGPDIYNEDADNIVRNSTSDLVSGKRNCASRRRRMGLGRPAQDQLFP